MSFQWVFDNAQSISVDQKAIVGQTITRNQTVRAVSRGNAVKKYTVNMPEGMRWSTAAADIATIESLNRFTVANINLTSTGYASTIITGPVSGGNVAVICVELPTWTVSPGDLVSWSGPFVFYESKV
jgi:hypothetical protein